MRFSTLNPVKTSTPIVNTNPTVLKKSGFFAELLEFFMYGIVIEDPKIKL